MAAPISVTGAGWFAQPSDPAGTWAFHPVDLCPDNCSHMYIDDLNGDGVPDIIGASPHNYGAWWWEHTAGDHFVQYEIDTSISENHSARYVDLDGDGVPELITGKRYWAHLDHDAGARDPVVLVAYRHHREAGEVIWDQIDIDDDSGVGSHNRGPGRRRRRQARHRRLDQEGAVPVRAGVSGSDSAP